MVKPEVLQNIAMLLNLKIIKAQLRRHGVTTFEGVARFVDPHAGRSQRRGRIAMSFAGGGF